MLSSRPPEDKAWNYVRPISAVKDYLYFEPHGTDTYECVVLDGLPSKVVSNSSDPPNSFHTSDLFSPHSIIPNAWKFLGRSDDRVTLMNGEKVLPLPFEHHMRRNELVKEALVFGIGKAMPGILIVPSDNASGLSKGELFDMIWPSIQSANSRVEGFSQISKEMVEILAVGTDYPQTDKGTMIRAASYKRFAEIVESVYDRFETGSKGENVSKLALGTADLETYLLELFSTSLNLTALTKTTDFFDAGVDSLQAIRIWGSLIRDLDLGSGTLGRNVVFEYPNVEFLAKHIYALRTGAEARQDNEVEAMAELIQKYSKFAQHQPGAEASNGQIVVSDGGLLLYTARADLGLTSSSLAPLAPLAHTYLHN